MGNLDFTKVSHFLFLIILNTLEHVADFAVNSPFISLGAVLNGSCGVHEELKRFMKKYFIPFLSSLPCVLIGTIIMYVYEVSINIYARNLLYLIICSVLLSIYLSKKFNIELKQLYLIAILNVLLLCSSFFFEGIEDVHRWVYIGPLALNIAFISLPVLLIIIYNLSKNGHSNICYILILVIAIVLFLQPDASMLTAFSIALIPFHYANSKNKFLKYSWIILLILSCISWANLDNLAPVPYIEDILILAINQNLFFLFCCVFSFIIMLIPFFKKNNCMQCKAISISLGLFFLVLILSTLFGNFPVPLIGYGVSPIVGYLLSVSYVEKNRCNCIR